ncbi:MAG: hypothetical protein M1834_009105 [Cirrosporium novae-zelandiae]|nr:MAG: hypothetical protein M1834_009105 [Cirrosporium novae-zelandiae]
MDRWKSWTKKIPQSRYQALQLLPTQKSKRFTHETQSQTTHSQVDLQSSSTLLEVKTKDGVIPKWRPALLRRRILCVFITIFIAMLIALEVLYQISNHHQGLTTSDQSKHYLWTYGPTAILTLVAAFWARLEYRAKQLAPWMAMAQGPTPAETSLLADYISSTPPGTIFDAFKHGRHLVALAVMSSLLINLLIIFSTGLLSLDNMVVKLENVPFIASNGFNDNADNLASLASVGNMPYYVVNGIQSLNMSYPQGTNEDYAFQSFNSSKLLSNSTLQAVVDGFSVDLECENGTVNISSWQGYNTYNAPILLPLMYDSEISVSTSSCHVANVSFGEPSLSAEGAEAYLGSIQSGRCTNIEGDDGFRMLLLLGRSRQGPTVPYVSGKVITNISSISSSTEYTNTTNMTLVRSTQLICKPTYAINRLSVVMNGTESSSNNVNVSLISNTTSRTISNVHGSDISQAFFDSFDNSIWEASKYNVISENPDVSDTMFDLAREQMPDLQLTDFFDLNILKEASLKAYRKLCAQIAKRTLLKSKSSSIVGTAWVSENRLVVQSLSVRLMESILAVLLAFALVMAILTPSDGVVSHDPGSIGGLAHILARSPDVTQSLSGMGSSSMKAISRHISGHRYQTITSSKEDLQMFGISLAYRLDPEIEQNKGPNRSSEGPIKWWHPFSVTIYARILLLAIIIAIIIALELVLRQSQHHNGLADVDFDGYTHYIWSYIPALVMLGIATLFNMVDFSTKIFAPYSMMKSSIVSSQKTLSVNFLEKMTPHALWDSLKLGYYAVFATALGSLLGSYLTIIVSGVYTTENVPYTQPMTLQRLDWFNQSSHSSSSNADAAMIAGLVVEANLSYPSWTYKEFAFPKLSILSSSNESVANQTSPDSFTTTLDIQLPAIRSTLNCTLYQGTEQLSVNTRKAQSSTGTTPLAAIHAYYPGSQEQINIYTARDSIFGQALDGTSSSGGSYWWGSVSDYKVTKISALNCDESTSQVDVAVRFSLPDLEISSSHPPTAIESTAKHFSSAVLSSIELYLPNISTTTSTSTTFTNFFSLLLASNNNVTLSTLSTSSSDNTITTAIKSLHSIIRAQQYNVDIRDSNPNLNLTNASLPLKNLTGTSTSKSTSTSTSTTNSHLRLRLIQNAAPTRVLEVLLALLFLTALVAPLLMRTRRVLPKNPCSIAAVASFIAGSGVGGEGEGVWERKEVVMGWFGDGDGEEEGGGRKERRFGIGFADGDGDGYGDDDGDSGRGVRRSVSDYNDDNDDNDDHNHNYNEYTNPNNDDYDYNQNPNPNPNSTSRSPSLSLSIPPSRSRTPQAQAQAPHAETQAEAQSEQRSPVSPIGSFENRNRNGDGDGDGTYYDDDGRGTVSTMTM